jgi:hypothetical protein
MGSSGGLLGALAYTAVSDAPLSPYKYGAAGDGVTDDSAAFAAMNTALPAAGGEIYAHGAFYLPTGVAFTKPVKLRGAGAGDLTLAAPSKIITDGNAVTAVDFQADGSIAEDLLVVCNAPAPVAGSRGIKFTKGILAKLRGVHVAQFYDNIDFVDGSYWQIVGGMSLDPVNYALKINSLQGAGDWGDPSIEGMHFGTKNLNRSPAAAIRYESGGGLKIAAIKIVSGFNTLYRFVRGLDAVISAGTSVLTMAASSVEGCTDRQVSISQTGAGGFGKVAITGNEFLGSPAGAPDGVVAAAVDNAHDNNIRDVLIGGNVFYGLNRGIYAQSMRALALPPNEFSSDNVGAPTVITPIVIGNDVWAVDMARQSYGWSDNCDLFTDAHASTATVKQRLGTIDASDSRDILIAAANAWTTLWQFDLPTSGAVHMTLDIDGINSDAGQTTRPPFSLRQVRQFTRDQGGTNLTTYTSANGLPADVANGTQAGVLGVRYIGANGGATIVVQLQTTDAVTYSRIQAVARLDLKGTVARLHRGA